jgi:hypothetical protein
MSDSVSSRTRSKASIVEDEPPLPTGRIRRKNLRNILESSNQATLPATNSDADETSVVSSNDTGRASSLVCSSIENIHHGSSPVHTSMDANTTLQASYTILSSDDDEDSFQACSLIDSGIDANQRSKGLKNEEDSFDSVESTEKRRNSIYDISSNKDLYKILNGNSSEFSKKREKPDVFSPPQQCSKKFGFNSSPSSSYDVHIQEIIDNINDPSTKFFERDSNTFILTKLIFKQPSMFENKPMSI